MQVLQGHLQQCDEEKVLKASVMKLGEDLLSRTTVLKALHIQVRLLGEERSKSTEKTPPCCKTGCHCLSMSSLRPKRYAKETKNLIQQIEDQYLGLSIHI